VLNDIPSVDASKSGVDISEYVLAVESHTEYTLPPRTAPLAVFDTTYSNIANVPDVVGNC
jgi:hypothetical protein